MFWLYYTNESKAADWNWEKNKGVMTLQKRLPKICCKC